MPYYQRNGQESYYIHKGIGQPIVFIHGFLGNSYVHWKNQLTDSYLSSQYQLIAPNIASFNRNKKKKLTKSKPLEDLYDLHYLLNKHITIPKRRILVGYSIGGALALAYALAFPQEVMGLLLISPLPFLNSTLPSWNMMPNKKKITVQNNGLTNAAWKVFKSIIKFFSLINLELHKNKMNVFLKKLNKLSQVPILMTYGREDSINPIKAYKTLIKHLPKKNTEIIAFPGDHGFFHKHSNNFNELLFSFCNKLSD